MSTPAPNVEQIVRERYSAGAREREESLCCPVEYDPQYLKILPEEILERDYGCGDPSQFVREGETVLDLGSGGGKICYIAAQKVGASGRVIGVDMNDEMLALARKYRGEMAEKLGYDVVDFRKGRIQDLALDWEKAEAYLEEKPIRTNEDLDAFEQWCAEQRAQSPLVPDGSVDVIVSNCVLNLVRADHKKQLFAEMHRVLTRGGRVAISDIVSDEPIPEHLQHDPELWSGCISGAFQEREFLRAFEDAGFYGIEIVKRDQQPWQTVEGIEFRSVTVMAYKGKEGECLEANQAVIYNGPFREVSDDDGHRYVRGELVAVCEKTFHILTHDPYGGYFTAVEPREPVTDKQKAPFLCQGYALRDPRRLKGADYRVTTENAGACCAPAGGESGADGEGSCC